MYLEMLFVDVGVCFLVSALDSDFDLLAEYYHLFEEEDMPLPPSREDVSRPTSALPDVERIL